MTLLIIRHGESEADILNVHEGRIDGGKRRIVFSNMTVL